MVMSYCLVKHVSICIYGYAFNSSETSICEGIYPLSCKLFDKCVRSFRSTICFIFHILLFIVCSSNNNFIGSMKLFRKTQCRKLFHNVKENHFETGRQISIIFLSNNLE